MKDKFEPSINDLDLSFIGEEKSNLTSNENEDLSFNGNNVMNEGMPMQVYLSRPVVEPFDKFKKSLLDLGVEEGHSNFSFHPFGTKASRQSRKDKVKKALHDASVNISNTSHDAAKNVKDTTKVAVKNISNTIGDKLGGGVAVHAVNKWNPQFIALRGAFQSMILINLLDLAHAFSLIKEAKNKRHWEDIKQKWWMWGGEKNVLDSSVDRGKVKKAFAQEIFDKFQKKKSGFDGTDYSNASGSGAKTAGQIVAGVAAALGVATPILASFPETEAAAVYTGIGTGAMGALSPTISSFSKDNGATAADIAKIPPVTTITNAPIPTDPVMLAKINAEIDATTPVDEEAAVRAAVRKEKVAAGTYTAADAKLDELAAKKDSENSKKIMGMPKNVAIGVFVGVGLLLIIGGIVFFRGKKVPVPSAV